jgi:predicted transcriptional regulator
MKIKDQILKLFESSNELSVKEITDELLVTKQAVHYVLNQLLEEKKIEKLGRTPKTIYRLIKDVETLNQKNTVEVSKEQAEFLAMKFLLITETGKMIKGIEAFEHWCNQRKLPIKKTLEEYIITQQKYDAYFDKNGFINGTEKLKNTTGYKHIWLDKLYYIDFYAIERFGKTQLGTLLHYAKQGQSKMLMKILMDEIKEKLLNFIKQNSIDAIGFVPPTIKRETQLMKFIQT